MSVTHIFYRELTLDEGFNIMRLPQNQRLIGGKECSRASGFALFESVHPTPMRCWHCNAQADRWVLDLGKKDSKSKPVLNLYGMHFPKPTKRHKNPAPIMVLMTQDHIIPKSLGGVDSIANLRVGCAICNRERGSKMSAADNKFMLQHPELIDPVRLRQAQEAARRFADQLTKNCVRDKKSKV